MSDQPTTEVQKYLEWSEGDNVVFLTGVSVKRADQASTPPKRAEVKLTFTTKPTAEGYDAPFTNHVLRLPFAVDDQRTRIMLDQLAKQVLWPLAEVPADAVNVRIAQVLQTIKKNLDTVDFKCEVTMKGRKGTGLNSRTGEPNMFYDIVGFKPVEAIAKKPYESGIDYDLDDLAF